ncbi:hypothetical protein AGLY_008223 [Aphis glycines]|uniref:Uncharacterized protein n=1 Tax=Aphis glycines TaxID=307491 RepID=A0A6G0TLN9_APHGL|nr:hypothetical protein AGLY_008223 [Aphis glycines]
MEPISNFSFSLNLLEQFEKKTIFGCISTFLDSKHNFTKTNPHFDSRAKSIIQNAHKKGVAIRVDHYIVLWGTLTSHLIWLLPLSKASLAHQSHDCSKGNITTFHCTIYIQCFFFSLTVFCTTRTTSMVGRIFVFTLIKIKITFSLFKISRVPIIDGVETDFCKGSLACNKQDSTALSLSEWVEEVPLNLRLIRPTLLFDFWRRNDVLSVVNKFAVLSVNGSSVSDSILLKLALKINYFIVFVKSSNAAQLLLRIISFSLDSVQFFAILNQLKEFS